jgi:hypothetical protein
MEPFRDDQDLAAALSALRPAPRPAFAAELDERAAAGFPRRSSDATSPLAALGARLRSLRLRQVLIPAGATALAAVAAVTVVVAVSEPSPDQSGSTIHGMAGGSQDHNAALGLQGDLKMFSEAAPATAEPTKVVPMAKDISPPSTDSGPFAAQAGHREVERAAQMVLATEPDEVGAAAAEVFDTVHSYNGIVLRSSTEGGGESAGASFDLLIPSAKLSDALGAFSAIAEVRSRHESTLDVTARTVGLDERLVDARAAVAGLLEQLADADTPAERAATEAELHSARQRVANLRGSLASLERRTNFSRVSLQIESDAGASSADSGGWSVGDAIDDAGHILAVAAGVAIVALAIVGPLALIALLLWLGNRARVRHGRERALG